MEPIRDAAVIAVAEPTQTAVARRAAADLCRRLQLSEATIARAELIAVELAGNILHHAERGHLFLAPVPGDSHSIQVIAVDHGPGVGDTVRAMQDGFSTSTTPGLGLGAIRRQADALDLYSRSGVGTIIAATLHDLPVTHSACDAVLSRHVEGETLNGDSWAVYSLEDRTVYLVVDGLGHGHYAAQASATAIGVADHAFAAEPDLSLSAVIQRMHLPMQSTRGAAVLLVSVPKKPSAGEPVLCCGVGNIAGVLCAPDGTCRSLVSHNGTVGHRLPRVQEFSYPLFPGNLLILHSDGISARWKLAQYPGLLQHSPAIVAAILFRDGVRDRDDATILVARLNGASAHA
jgi:anti-sigma regulatory factor (Ser/Thr protein kinase)